MHPMIDYRNGLEVKVAHPVYFQLESQRWLQMSVNPIFCELLMKEINKLTVHF